MDQTSEAVSGAEAGADFRSDERYVGWAGEDIYAEVAKLPWPTLPDAPTAA